jgi:hypothetical protein
MENAFFIPILPGKTTDAVAFAECLCGERKSDLDQAQVTVTKESWFLQETPMGDFLIVYYHAPDARKVGEALASSQEPFDVWFRSQVLEITGIDFSQPPKGSSKQILNWSL